MHYLRIVSPDKAIFSTLINWWRSVVVKLLIRSTKLLYAGLGYYCNEWLPVGR